MSTPRSADGMLAPLHEEALLIPWRLTGRLSEAEAARLDAHLVECAECREDLAQERALLRVFSAEAEAEPGARAALQALWTRIDAASEARSPPAQAPRAHSSTARPTWLLAAGILLSFGLGLAAAAMWRVGAGLTADNYSTAASATAPAAAPAALRVVFADGLTVAELSALLEELELAVVDGPGVSGIFALAPAPGSRVDVGAALERLRADPRVRFAEPTAALEPRTGALR